NPARPRSQAPPANAVREAPPRSSAPLLVVVSLNRYCPTEAEPRELRAQAEPGNERGKGFAYSSRSQRQHRTRPGEAAAEGDEDDGIAPLCPSGANRLVQRQRYRRRRGVAVAVEVHHHLVAGKLHVADGGVDDPLVDLVRNQQGDVVGGEAALA